MRKKQEIVKRADYEFHVLGGERLGIREAYHAILTMPWWAALGVIVVGYLALNAVFALVYLLTGGITNAEPGSFIDAFFFSVQTMGTIGYGAMYPATRLANAAVVAESVIGLVVTALATGIVFMRFSLQPTKVVFSKFIAYSPMNGVPTLMIRVGNERRNVIVDASVRLNVTRRTKTLEGMDFFTVQELKLVRDKIGGIGRMWNALHRVDEASPLFGDTPDSLRECEAEFSLSVVGTDETTLNPVHGAQIWKDDQLIWGARPADCLSEDANRITLDLGKFHQLISTEPTDKFPYSDRVNSLAK